MSLLLAKEIFKLFLIMFLSLAATKMGFLKADDASALSRMSLYLIVPCLLLTAYQVEFNMQVLQGILVSAAVGILAHIVFIGLGSLLKKPAQLNEMERASIIYTNSGNLVIPLIISVLGPEWVIYSMGYSTVQTITIWTHGFSLFAGREQISIKKIFQNINLLILPFGLYMLVSGNHLPDLIASPMASIGNMVGPVAMVVNGMLLSRLSLKDLFFRKRIYLIFFLRMVVCPAAMLVLMKVLHMDLLPGSSEEVLLIALLCTAAPVASTITQFAQLYDKDAAASSAINIMTTLSCIVTIPLIVQIYFM